MQRISRREFVKGTAFAGAMLTSLAELIDACTSGSNTTSKTTTLTTAADQGAEDGPLKKAEPLYQTQTGITLERNVEMFMYRRDLASTAPASWNDVLANAQKFNKSNFYG